VWKWLSELLKDKRKPSEYIRLYLSRTGNGFELDDLVSLHDRDPEWQDVIKEILSISNQFSTAEYPIGISNPGSSGALERVADRLEAEGR